MPRDDTIHEWRYRRTVLSELDNRPDHNLRIVHRCKSEEPSVVRAMGILSRARLACNAEVRHPLANCGAALHHHFQHVSQRQDVFRRCQYRHRLRDIRVRNKPRDRHPAVAASK